MYPAGLHALGEALEALVCILSWQQNGD